MTDLFARVRSDIADTLDALLPSHSEIAQPMVDAMRHAVLGGGKRMRPLMACAACEAFSGSFKAALPAACGLEFIHAYSLIHDDLPAMDDDELRHGQAATHVAFGEANAILAGDSLHSLAFQSLAEAPGLSQAAKLRCITLLSTAAGWPGMAGGQCLDIAAEGENLSLARLEALHSAKTGALIEASLVIGAYCAEVEPDDPRLALLRTFGQRIGLAFQIVDDILDVTESSQTLGKPAGSDDALNKNTFPKLMGLESAQHRAEALLSQSLALLEEADLATELLTGLAERSVKRRH
ncbi:MAG: polyprenyl synthetase family protein [Pseudomonadales bacterium]|nr:polyprenyl synthetase family protein [Pseudomonadales bacterium]MBL6814028.1 polyprenyl synthetase family protein [Pseudomonadales bacterium]